MTKIFVAYLLPQPSDVFNLLEDGIQWITKGTTRSEAEANLRALFDEQMKEEFYTKEQAQAIWEQHQLYTAEV